MIWVLVPVRKPKSKRVFEKTGIRAPFLSIISKPYHKKIWDHTEERRSRNYLHDIDHNRRCAEIRLSVAQSITPFNARPCSSQPPRGGGRLRRHDRRRSAAMRRKSSRMSSARFCETQQRAPGAWVSVAASRFDTCPGAGQSGRYAAHRFAGEPSLILHFGTRIAIALRQHLGDSVQKPVIANNISLNDVVIAILPENHRISRSVTSAA